jgi:putative ABC transport system substrate-binding protein
MDAGSKLGLEVTPVSIESVPDGLSTAFATAVAAQDQAVVLLADDQFIVNGERIKELATTADLPVLAWNRGFARGGALASWGSGVGENAWRAAEYVAKILRGAKPAELPIGFPYQTDLAINLKTAQAHGISVPDR